MDSITTIIDQWEGSHTVAAYSIFERIKVLYSFNEDSEEEILFLDILACGMHC